MGSLAEQLSEYMDDAERTIQGAFCSLINWGQQAVSRGESKTNVIGICGRWWLDHEPDDGVPISTAWLSLGECIADLIFSVGTNSTEAKHEGV